MRAGARTGRVSKQLKAAIKAEANELEAIADPAARVRAAGDAYAALDRELEAMAQVWMKAVAYLRDQGWSNDRIAKVTDLSKAREAQISQAAGLGGRRRRPAE